MTYNRLKQEKGFSLIELMISMVIGTLILGLVGNTFIFQQKTYDVQGQITEMIQMTRAAMDTMTREIRMAGYDPVPRMAGFTGIPYNATQLQILADLNDDGVITTSSSGSENIIYFYYNYTIRRQTGTASNVLVDQVESFDFRYLDADGNPTTIPADIRQAQITLTLRTAKPDPAPRIWVLYNRML